MKTIKGDLIELALNGKFDLIILGCNCFCTIGAGLTEGDRNVISEIIDEELLDENHTF